MAKVMPRSKAVSQQLERLPSHASTIPLFAARLFIAQSPSGSAAESPVRRCLYLDVVSLSQPQYRRISERGCQG